VGTDRPDEPENPPDGHADRRDDQGGDGGRTGRSGGAPAEDRDRGEYYVALRRAVSTEETLTARRVAAEEQAAYEKWEKTGEEAHWMWSEHQRKWPPGERPQVDSSDDEPGSWRGEGDTYLSRADNERVDAQCDRIADREREKITPAMREIESQDPDRHLVGLEDSRKGRDRIKEKVSDRMEEKNRTPEEAVSLIPDTLRYTFQYQESRYTQGVWAEMARMKERGLKMITCKNYWEAEEYKGINSQWIEPDTGQRFELQFHTRISFEAKQITHKAYERLRSGQPDEFEKMVLKAFQRKVSAEIPIPAGATDIPDYPERSANAR
jgi:hypothetical protein